MLSQWQGFVVDEIAYGGGLTSTVFAKTIAGR
jgi:hypothetical protein